MRRLAVSVLLIAAGLPGCGSGEQDAAREAARELIAAAKAADGQRMCDMSTAVTREQFARQDEASVRYSYEATQRKRGCAEGLSELMSGYERPVSAGEVVVDGERASVALTGEGADTTPLTFGSKRGKNAIQLTLVDGRWLWAAYERPEDPIILGPLGDEIECVAAWNSWDGRGRVLQATRGKDPERDVWATVSGSPGSCSLDVATPTVFAEFAEGPDGWGVAVLDDADKRSGRNVWVGPDGELTSVEEQPPSTDVSVAPEEDPSDQAEQGTDEASGQEEAVASVPELEAAEQLPAGEYDACIQKWNEDETAVDEAAGLLGLAEQPGAWSASLASSGGECLLQIVLSESSRTRWWTFDPDAGEFLDPAGEPRITKVVAANGTDVTVREDGTLLAYE